MIYAVKLNDGNWQSAVTLGISVVSRKLKHAGVDELRLKIVGQTIATDNSSFTYGTKLTLARFADSDTSFVGTPEYLFAGRITDVVRSASGESEGYNVLVCGSWEQFENTIYRQEWLESDTSAIYAPHCVLYYGGWDSQNGQDIRLNTIDQIADILSCANESTLSASFQFDSSTFPSSGHYPPFDERLNLTVADALRTVLANHPNLLLYFDHSTNPPTCNVRMRSDLSAVSFALSSLASVDVKRRDDLIPSAVCLAYIYTDTISGKTYTHTEFDYAPHISGETESETKARLYQSGTLWGTYEMQGSNSEYAEQKYTVDPILWNSVLSDPAYAKSFFQTRCPEIQGYTINSISVDTNYAPTYPNFLIDGAIQSWQNKDSATDTFKAKAVVSRSDANAPTDDSSQVIEKKDVELQFAATTTNLGGGSLVQRHTGTDRKLIGYDSGELVPWGFAQALYNEWQTPQYEGSVMLVQQETPASYYLGKVLNITGGRSEWSTMKALITEVTEDFANGNLTISFGTGGWIDLNARVAWMRACYNRRYSWRRNLKTKGEDSESNTIGIDAVPNSEGGSPVADYRRLVLFNPSVNNSHGITLDPNIIENEPSPKVIQPRKIKVLVESTDPNAQQGEIVTADVWCLCSLPVEGEPINVDLSNIDLRYNTSNHRLEITRNATEANPTWQMITGGQAVQEVTT